MKKKLLFVGGFLIFLLALWHFQKSQNDSFFNRIKEQNERIMPKLNEKQKEEIRKIDPDFFKEENK